MSVCKLVAEEIARNKPGNARTVLKRRCAYPAVWECASVQLSFPGPAHRPVHAQGPRATASLRCLSLVYPVAGITACYSGYFYAVGRICKPVFAQVFEQLVTSALPWPWTAFWAAAWRRAASAPLPAWWRESC